jgi:putative SOS response-associated peptidase YedK
VIVTDANEVVEKMN